MDSILSDSNKTFLQQTIEAAQQCVMCGLCSKDCPTYNFHRKEPESPRGRIALVAALAKGELDPAEANYEALTDCLGCRQCEEICPSKVKYHDIWTAGLRIMREKGPGHSKSIARSTINSSKKRDWLRKSLLFYQSSGLQWLAKHSGSLKALGLEHIDSSLPKISANGKLLSHYPAHIERKGRVNLFIGCVSDVLENGALQASIRVLNRCEYAVHVPKGQNCCGAMALHAGEHEEYLSLARKNLDGFSQEQLRLHPVLGLNSGCVATLKEYGAHEAELNNNGARKPGRFSSRIHDIIDFLNTRVDWGRHSIRRAEIKVAIHESCSARNVLHNSTRIAELLGRIPGLTILPTEKGYSCCGAGGERMLKPDKMQLALRNQALDSLTREKPDIIVSTNLGCSMHLAGGLSSNRQQIEILHPVTLLDRYLA